MADQNLKIIISAEQADAIKKMADLAKSLDNVGKATDGVKQKQESMATSVFKGVASWDLLKKGISTTVDFLGDSIKASIEAESKMNLVRATVASMGKNYAEVAPQIQDFANKMQQMGRDDEEVSLATVKLAKAVGGDLTKGMQMAKLASDLTASGYGTMESNVDNLSKVLIGKGARALLEYKINLGENASTLEQLNAIQDKAIVKTEDWAKTSEGQIATLQGNWQNFKENVGYIFGPALTIMFGNFNKFLSGTNENTISWSKLMRNAIASAFEDPGRTIGDMLNRVVVTGLEKVKSNAENVLKKPINFANPFSLATTGASLLLDKTGLLDKGINKLNDSFTKSSIEVAKNEVKYDSISLSVQKLDDNITGVSNANNSLAKNAKQDAKDLENSISNLKDEYEKFKEKGVDALTVLEEEHQKNLSSIRDNISKTQQSIKDLQKEYSRGQQSDTKNIAEEVVATEQRIAEIKKELSGEVSDERRKELESELSKNQTAMEKNADFIKSIDGAIVEARRVAGLSDLERAIEEYNQRRALADQEYQEKLQRLNAELSNYQAQQKAEVELHAQKQAIINQMITDGNKNYQELLAKNFKTTKDIIEQEIQLYNRLAQAIANARGGSLGQINNIKSNTITIPKLASGGVVTAPTLALVGEAGPEAVVPLKDANTGVGGGITINITGNQISDSLDVRKIADKVGEVLMGKLKLNAKVAV